MAKTQKAPPPRHYWDACVFLSYIDNVPERADIIERLLQQCADGEVEIWTSHFSLIEVAFASEEKLKRALDPVTLDNINSLWQPPSKIRLVELSEEVAYRARNTMREGIKNGWSLKGKDAIHLASASGCVRFLTYESKLVKFGDLLSITVCQPEMPPEAPPPPDPMDALLGKGPANG